MAMRRIASCLSGNVIRARSDIKYTLIQDDFSFEPYGLMMRRDPRSGWW